MRGGYFAIQLHLQLPMTGFRVIALPYDTQPAEPPDDIESVIAVWPESRVFLIAFGAREIDSVSCP
jgi:hypothetical protein